MRIYMYNFFVYGYHNFSSFNRVSYYYSVVVECVAAFVVVVVWCSDSSTVPQVHHSNPNKRFRNGPPHTEGYSSPQAPQTGVWHSK